MWKIIISFLVLVISLPYSAFGTTVSGTVVNEDNEPLASASVQLLTADGQSTSSGTTTDIDGKFAIDITDKSQKIRIYYMGYETETLNATNSLRTIQLTPSNTSLKEVISLACKCGQIPNEESTECITDTTIGTTCQPTTTDATEAKWQCDKNKPYTDKKCIPTKCNTNLYKQIPQNGKCVSLNGTPCTIQHATVTKYECTAESCICKVQENNCQNDYVPNADGTGCVSTKCPNCQIWNDETKKCEDDSNINQDCTSNKTGAKKATYVCENNEQICKIDECNSAYEKTGNQCQSLTGTKCSNPPLHATDTSRTFDDSGNEICHVVKCKGGYKPSEDKSSCVPAKEYDMDALEQNADQAHENENSLANRMLGGASMAAMGIGGMELARGIAEQNADADAERDMTAYLATFKCEYGPNHADGNTTGNEVPGANQLFTLYQEYAALASSVKATKEALNMTPGIESQVILDKANIGLYDDVSTGKTNGTYASLYRAKMGSDVDQAKLQEMSDTSKNRVIGGAVAAGAGAIAGIGGDVLLNQIDWNKNNSDAEDAK